MSIGDWIALSVIAFALICAVVYMVKNRKKGCSGCPYSDTCGKKECERKSEDERTK